ncbi:translation initiation factor IF-3 [Thermoactinomyces sp. DSM 45891]|uniref:Translation initiation factor IF-3 n=1 Tax=Croceifilum oryzae TaxID=1553429 RepID=A0AAJ1TIT1_9BACL|nr:translation initiation factor IF-3 [Croceifilum oryzae]SDZ18771.1 translation initiation factor IF-3 [Thermoactinomyces sp. DSM 45892]SFX77025.1 translation initiation factor IF-3 [Thermoactinomyces sp. DSM 45891]
MGASYVHTFLFYLYYIFWRWQVISKDQQHQINEAIRAREVRLIDANGDQAGIVALRDALKMAQEQNLDLVNIAPQAKPPVCRIMNYGKFRYEQSKKDKETRKNQKIVQLKEVRLSASIEENDVQTKLKHVIKFLQHGDKVKLSIRFRGRQITHQELGRKVLDRVAQEVKEIADVERPAKLEGRQMIMILNPKQQS